MKQTYRSFLLVMAVAAMLLNACGAIAAPNLPVAPVAAKVDASIIAYTGVIESMDGNQWVINGQTLSVDPAVVQGGPFQVGDTVKVEGIVNADGSFTVSSIESPSASDLAGSSSDENANTNDNENINDDDSNDDNANDNSNLNDNDNDDEDDNANDNNGNDDDFDDDDSSDNSNGASQNGNNGSGHADDDSHDDDGQGGGDDDSGDDDD